MSISTEWTDSCVKCKVLKERDRLLEFVKEDAQLMLAVISLYKIGLKIPEDLVELIENRIMLS